jgi:uncharacterized protein YwgA
MDAPEIVVAVVAATRSKNVAGRKRLQKLTYFLERAGGPSVGDFQLRQFGPYSEMVARETSVLVAFGDLNEKVQPLGTYGTFQSVYSLADATSAPRLPTSFSEFISELDGFSTLELEIAATIDYFRRMENDLNKAIDLTRDMKPTKTTPSVVAKANSILSIVDQWNGKRSKDQRSNP